MQTNLPPSQKSKYNVYYKEYTEYHENVKKKKLLPDEEICSKNM